MTQSPDQAAQPIAAVEMATLNYSRPNTKISWSLHAAMAIVAVMDVIIGAVLVFVGVSLVASHGGSNVWVPILGILLFVPGVTLWMRNTTSWWRSYILLYLNGLLLSALALMAVLRLWHDIGRPQTDALMFNLTIGGAWGALNFCGAYILCRAKRAFLSEQIDTLWCERACVATVIPFALLATGIWIVLNYYP